VIDTRESATTPRLTADWKIDPSTTLYANVAKGFRFGGANRPVPNTDIVISDMKMLGLTPPPPPSFAPDSLWNYEVGSKSELWARRVTLNLAAFYIDWKNLQQDIVLPNAGFDFETNTGNAHSVGLEAELKARVTPELTLQALLGITHAVFSEDVPAFGVTTDANGNTVPNVRKGDEIQGVPRGNATLGADYHWAVSDAVGAFVRGDVQWVGQSHGSLFRGDNDYIRPAYTTADASAGANWGRWEVMLFVKNLTDNHTIIQRPSIQNVSEAYYLRPRTTGLTVNYAF
jgi:outer membrane receptor protein involved in Fe transport